MSDTPPEDGPSSADSPGRTRAGPNLRRRASLLLAALVLLGLAAIAGLDWWAHGRFVESPNDAYLRDDQVTVAPKVSGYVHQLFVTDNQAVAAGQPLLRIDSMSYGAALAHQTADVDARRADLAAAQRQVDQQQAIAEHSKAQLLGAQANAAYASREAERFRTLSAQGVETRERYAQAQNQRDQAGATVRSDAAALRGAQLQIATLRSQVGQARAQLEAAAASARSAQLNLGDTTIRAAISGRVGDETVRMGQFVEPGTRMMSIVPVDKVYLVANFKETQIGRMRIGQDATVKIDALGGRTIRAVLDSFAPGTGSEFALLPPENATGNFTKIVQRVPVRFRLEPPAEVRDHLLPGLSATVKVDTNKAPEGLR